MNVNLKPGIGAVMDKLIEVSNQVKKLQEQEEARRASYTETLNLIDQDIRSLQDRKAEIIANFAPDGASINEKILKGEEFISQTLEKNPDLKDFLEYLKIKKVPVETPVPVEVPNQHQHQCKMLEDFLDDHKGIRYTPSDLANQELFKQIIPSNIRNSLQYLLKVKRVSRENGMYFKAPEQNKESPLETLLQSLKCSTDKIIVRYLSMHPDEKAGQIIKANEGNTSISPRLSVLTSEGIIIRKYKDGEQGGFYSLNPKYMPEIPLPFSPPISEPEESQKPCKTRKSGLTKEALLFIRNRRWHGVTRGEILIHADEKGYSPNSVSKMLRRIIEEPRYGITLHDGYYVSTTPIQVGATQSERITRLMAGDFKGLEVTVTRIAEILGIKESSCQNTCSMLVRDGILIKVGKHIYKFND